jgi:hypothetical protein
MANEGMWQAPHLNTASQTELGSQLPFPVSHPAAGAPPPEQPGAEAAACRDPALLQAIVDLLERQDVSGLWVARRGRAAAPHVLCRRAALGASSPRAASPLALPPRRVAVGGTQGDPPPALGQLDALILQRSSRALAAAAGGPCCAAAAAAA